MAAQVTQVCEFECCYVVDKQLNAHRYKVEVTVDGPQREEDLGYVIEFSKLSEYLRSILPDKRFIFETVSQNIGREIAFTMGQRGIAIQGYSFILSAENILTGIVQDLQSVLDIKEPGVRVVSAKLRENTSSYVTWKPE